VSGGGKFVRDRLADSVKEVEGLLDSMGWKYGKRAIPGSLRQISQGSVFVFDPGQGWIIPDETIPNSVRIWLKVTAFKEICIHEVDCTVKRDGNDPVIMDRFDIYCEMVK
jgi:hypothetical protein